MRATLPFFYLGFGMILWFGMTLISSAWAQSPLVAWGQGRFEAAETPEEINVRLEKAKKESIAASNFMVRKAVGKRLDGKPNMCRGYQIDTTESRMRITCDDKPTIDIMLDGSKTIYPNPRGKDLEILAEVNDATISQTFESKIAGLKVIYTFSRGKLRVRKEIFSDYLGKPLVIEADYVLKRSR